MPDPKGKNALESLDYKADFLIETMEQFIDIPKLQIDFQKQSIINARAHGIELPEDFAFSPKETWQLLICHTAVRWAIKKGLNPGSFANGIQSSMGMLYTADINEKLN